MQLSIPRSDVQLAVLRAECYCLSSCRIPLLKLLSFDFFFLFRGDKCVLFSKLYGLMPYLYRHYVESLPARPALCHLPRVVSVPINDQHDSLLPENPCWDAAVLEVLAPAHMKLRIASAAREVPVAPAALN